MRSSRIWVAVAGVILLAAIAWFFHNESTDTVLASAPPAGLRAVRWPADNPYSAEKAELGRLLFFDPRLSKDDTVSCASCHNPRFAFGESTRVSTGIGGHHGMRNAPSLLNSAYGVFFFWDGRSATLEDQVSGPMTNPIEMGNTMDAAAARLRSVAGYRPLFERSFGSPEITAVRIQHAVATFERTILSGNSPYDRYLAGDRKALSESQVRGIHVFKEARCNACHEGANFTNGMFANIGVGADNPDGDPGRSAITHNDRDWGTFKTPSLRDVAATPPYMHDGSLKTLEDVVEFYDGGGIPNKNLDNRIRPLHLTAAQKADLTAFLRALNGEGWQNIKRPQTLPQ